MNEVTRILDAIGQGDAGAAAQSCRWSTTSCGGSRPKGWHKRSRARRFRPTALVHEAYLRLVGQGEERHWDSRGHFFAAAAEAMRRILIDNARRKLEWQTWRRPGRPGRPTRMTSPWQTLATRSKSWPFNEALDRLAERSPRKAELVKLRYFLGLHDGRGGPDPGYRPGDRRRGLDLRQGLAVAGNGAGMRKQFAGLKKSHRAFALPFLALDDREHHPGEGEDRMSDS